MQEASAWRRYSTGFGAISLPSRIAGSSASSVNGLGCESSLWAPENVATVEQFLLPVSHWFRIRNLNLALDGVALTASMVAKRLSTATPLVVAASFCAVAMFPSFLFWAA